jgi:hypothetical protein
MHMAMKISKTKMDKQGIEGLHVQLPDCNYETISAQPTVKFTSTRRQIGEKEHMDGGKCNF